MHLDKEKVLACLAETIKTWNNVLMNEEGLKCVFAAEDNTKQLLACKANTTQHNTTQHNTTQHNTTQHNGAEPEPEPEFHYTTPHYGAEGSGAEPEPEFHYTTPHYGAEPEPEFHFTTPHYGAEPEPEFHYTTPHYGAEGSGAEPEPEFHRSRGSNYLNFHPTLTAAGSKFAQAVGKLGKAGKGGECWWEHNMHLDKEKVLACLAETIKTWNRVLMDEEGLKCVFAAQDNTEQLLACKAKHNGAKVNEVKANEVKASEVKANGAGAVTVNFFLGVSLAALLLVRAG